jgi:hypothetical protein
MADPAHHFAKKFDDGTADLVEGAEEVSGSAD